MIRLAKLTICLLLLTTIALAADSNWPNWRGPNTKSIANEGNYPTTWDTESKNVIWKIDTPGKGFSTPIIWNDIIYMTTGVDKQDTVLAYDMNGKLLWQKQLGEELPGRHGNASGANSSPVTDGKAIFAFFKSGRFAAVNLDGSVRWQFNLFERYGKDERYWDFGTSPVLTEKYAVMAQMHDGDSYVAAFDKATGELAWKVARNYETPQEGRQSYCTPQVYYRDGKETLLVWGCQHLTAHDTADGKLIWECGDFNPEEIKYWPSAAMPVIVDGIAVTPCGRSDRSQPRLHGIKMGGTGDVTKTNRLWSRDDIGPFLPNPTEYKGKVYLVDDNGKINCIDPKTGKDFWSSDLPKGKGKCYASPLIAGGYLYCSRESGTIYVLKLSGKYELVSEIDMKDKMIASFIGQNGHIFVRTQKTLYCLGEK